MKTLSQGKNSGAIFKLIRVLLNTNQNDYEEAVGGDTTDLLDVASQVETVNDGFGEDNTDYKLDENRELNIQLDEEKNWTVDMAPSVREDDEGNKFTYGVPSYVQDQIHSSKGYKVSDKNSGHRSAQFEQLLYELNTHN